eukprot:m.246838 g.246838  ORF g.246838 m.246838 type:complete len:430 (-) comp15857_c0_seq4:2984-4273(-)
MSGAPPSSPIDSAVASAVGVLLGAAGSAVIYRMLISGGSDSGGSDDFLEPPTIPRVNVERETTGGNVARFTSRERFEAKRRPATKWTRVSLDEAVVRAAVDRNKFRPQMRTPDPQRLRSSFVEGPSISALGGQAESVAALSSDDPVVIRARKPVALGEPVLKQLLTEPGSYGRLLNLCARNVVKGPPTEKCHEDAVYCNHTNVPANIFDKAGAPAITAAFLDMLQYELIESAAEPPVAPVAVVGIATGGGCMVAQMAATAVLTHPALASVVEFVYCRKKRMKIGTCHQLEGARHITERTSESTVIDGVWIDDVLTSGANLRDGILLLKNDYNIEISRAMFLTDDSGSRADLTADRLGTADPVVQDIRIAAFYDTSAIHAKADEHVFGDDSDDDEDLFADVTEGRPAQSATLSPELFRRASQIPRGNRTY